MVTQRLKNMSSFIVMDVMEKCTEMECRGEDVVHLEVGEPDFSTPACIIEAVTQALAEGCTHYTHSLGMPALREAISAHYHEKYAVSVDPDQIVVTSGSSPAIFMACAALLEAGDEVILSDPHYACYPNFITFFNGRCVSVPVSEADGFQYRPEAIRDRLGDRTRMILINSPANPTGTLLSADRMAAIAGLGPYILSDEIYHGLVYAGREHSILEYTDRAFVINGFSKLYAMTGLRLGYVIAPKTFARALQKLHQNFFISASAALQKAGIAALTLPQAQADVAHMRAVYNERRRYIILRLRQMGFNIQVEPTGAFYVFVNARHISRDSYALAFDILQHACVGVTPGIDFGPGGEGYL
ncbi:MAG: pyridoxal phosphate-dependent aminotransferase, partial [Desulfatitalea sp.]|nr:pyridoxal phosphate-dependent aminotransferase [Desulfatitalea sp.]NNK01976.1 pyridoxal phosphate-dependent aminotransferase [Desulfatitalea sp.]